jgi:hypothetical protein
VFRVLNLSEAAGCRATHAGQRRDALAAHQRITLCRMVNESQLLPKNSAIAVATRVGGGTLGSSCQGSARPAERKSCRAQLRKSTALPNAPKTWKDRTLSGICATVTASRPFPSRRE